MTRLLVGCPVLHREWVLEHWYDHLQVAATAVGITPELVFAGSRTTDPATFEIIDRLPDVAAIVDTAETKHDDRRDWGFRKARYGHMVYVRNALLEEVRRLAPDLFFSLDSDILLHHDTIRSLLDALDQHPEWGAVGARCHLFCTGNRHPSWANITRMGTLRRVDQPGGLFKVDVLLAAKLMRPAAYNVDYAYHPTGEDAGWALNCKTAGVTLGWDGRTCSKHLYTRDDLARTDRRVGF